MKKTATRFLMSVGLVTLGAGLSSGNPTGGSVSAGSASITTIPGTVTINQASNTAIINWQTFSIGAGELTKFVQPSAASATLNRVLGGGTSTIDGSLQANGQIIIINGNGIVIGPGGMVNTNSFIASTRDIQDTDFLSGNLHFTGSNSAGVQNSGSITAQNGDVILIGKTVNNEGTISAPNGTAALAAGDDVLLTQSGTQHVFVSPTATATSAATQTAVTNGGAISAAQAELAAANGNVYALAINNSGTIRANAVAQKGGRVFLTTDTGMVVNNGTICAKSGSNGGTIQFTGGSVWNRKTITASGTTGGRVQIQAENVQNDGSISTRGTASYGGNVYVTYTGNALGSVTGSVDASGLNGGGSIDFIGTGSTSESYLSMVLNAGSTVGQGGRIVVDSASVYLAGAKLTTNGPGGNGNIFLGVSDPVYSVTPVTAQTLYIGLGTTISANATSYGNGGTIIAEGTNTSANFGTVTATGRGAGDHNGTITIPITPASPPVVATTVGTGTTTGGGSTAKPAPAFEFVDPDGGPDNAFGRPVTGLFNLASNTTLVTSPGDSFAAAGAGAAYLFNDTTGALLSTIRGTSAGDGVGTTVQLLTSNIFAVETPGWNGDKGAITFGNGLHGFFNGGGAISAKNSLLGTTNGDEVGNGGLVKLFDGNYLVLSPDWNAGAGAVTWLNPVAGITGTVSAGNSLVGGSAGDGVGSAGIVQLGNGANYLVLSPTWSGGKGAITNGSDLTGVVGTVSAANSLVGASTTDGVGAAGSILQTQYGYYLALTSNFEGGAGAVTWNASDAGTTGVVSSDNSLVGSSATDHVGSGGITILSDDHNYVVSSPDWNGQAGAVTLGIGSQGVSGVVGSGNSLVGAAGGDEVGSGGIEQIVGSGGFVILSPDFNGEAGAVTLASDARGADGVISGSNSLVGATGGDEIGSGGITVLGNSNIVVLSPEFNNGAGAATFMPVPSNGGTPVTGVVSSMNSLVGSASGDEVGSGGVIQLSNGGNFLVLSPNWNNGAGAITNGDDFAGLNGVVSASNSLVGAHAGDHVGAAGSVTDPFTGYYLVTTANYGGTAGAITWNSDVGGTDGIVGASNSLVGASGDHIGSGGVQVLFDGNYLVLSPDYNGGAGAVTWGSSLGGVSGAVSSTNSLVGAAAGDHIGSGGIVQLNNASNYLVLSPEFNGGAGAITNGNSGTGISGIVSSANSLVGANSGDGVGASGSVIDTFNDYYLVKTANFDGGAGAVTWNASNGGTVGVVSAANSLVGSAGGDHVGSGGVTLLNDGNYVVVSPEWNNSTGAVTVGFADGGVSGPISAANSLVGAQAGDNIGSRGITLLPSGDFLVISQNFDAHAGAVTWVNSASGLTGTVSSANSLVGAQGGDLVGSDGVVLLNNGADYLVLSAHYNGNAGAVTEGSDTAGIAGVVGAGNSLLGANAGDGVGTAGTIQDTTYGYYLVNTLGFDGGAGAVTYNREANATIGVVSAANSLIGANPGDSVGSGGIEILAGNHGYVVSSPDFNGGAGASTFGSATAGISGVVGATNSLVGAASGDHIGSAGLLLLSNGNYLVLSPDFNGNAGAVTFVGGAGRDGVVGAANSLVGAVGGDAIGSGGIAELADGNYLVLSPDFNNGAGAVTFGSKVTGVAGTVGAANSLVGVNDGDHVGGGGIIFLSNGNYLVQSPDFASSAGAVTWGSATSGVLGQVTTANSIVGGMPDAGEEYGGESANGNVYLVSFTTDTSAGGDGRVVVGSTAGPSSTPALTDFFLLPIVDTVEASGFNFIANDMAFYVADPNATPKGTSDVDSTSGGALNSGHGANIASGSSTAFTQGHQRLVTPGNGIWNIFGGLVHSSPPPQWVQHELQTNLSPEVYAHLNEILFGAP